MNSFKLLFEEIRYRKTNFALSVFAITVASTVFVIGPTLIDGYGRDTQVRVKALQETTESELSKLDDETRKLMRDMGFNLMIVHSDTNMADFWADDFSTKDMPEDYIDRLAAAQSITLVTHLVASIQEKIDWNGQKVLLVGHHKETPQAHKPHKTPMGFDVEPGTVMLGHLLRHGMEEGKSVDILGKEFKVEKIRREQGSKEDISIVMNLADAQEVLGKKGRINQILALGCRCAGERLPKVRKQLEEVLPDTQITEFRSIALARAEQRDLVRGQKKQILTVFADNREQEMARIEKRAAIVTPGVVLACAIWVGLLALANVRDRRGEIGIFRALGVGSMTIASVFLSKATLQGLLGAAIAVPIGYGMARYVGIYQLEIAEEHLKLAGEVVVATVVGAPLVAAMASYLPTLSAIVQDPASILRELQ